MDVNDLEDDSVYTEVGNYYFSNEKLPNVQFIVGEHKKVMKAVRLPLINQSRAWWSMLSEDSPLVEKGDILMPDVEPEVFTLLLKHSYGGLESLDDLSVETVMNLCYCANKYFMKQLMKKIATRLEPKNVESVFPALYCLLFYNLKGVKEGVRKVIQCQTVELLEHPEFLECHVDLVVYICKQKALSCGELILWNAIVKWAEHKAESSEGSQLRRWMAEPLKHIRLLTLSAIDLKNYVFPLEILHYMEIINICKCDLSSVPSLCSDNSQRLCAVKNKNSIMTVDITQNATARNDHYHEGKESTYCFETKDKNIELQSVVIRGIVSPAIFNDQKEYLFKGMTQRIDLNVKITRITNLINNTSNETPVSRSFRADGNCFEKNTVSLESGITLLANSKYKVEFTFSRDMPCWNRPNCPQGHGFEHGKFYCSFAYQNSVGCTPCHILQFSYKVKV